MDNLRSLFLLNSDVTFLNHGSFGATSLPVFEVYQEWQRVLERQPVKFLGRDIGQYLDTSRLALGEYLNADKDDLVYFPNPTFAVNAVARALDLTSEDEVLTTNHEYGACKNVWQFLSQKRRFQLIEQPITLPVTTPEDVVTQFWQGVTPRTKVIFLSHITSETALRLPIEAICARAREAGILTIIDGAHAPGQISLDMQNIDADFYIGNCHKWLCSPKGAAFMYARRAQQHLLEPLVVGWGWGEDREMRYGSDFLDYFQWLGTNDLSAYLSVPAAIAFQAEHGWDKVRQQCHQLAVETLARIVDLTGLPPIYPSTTDFFNQMFVASLPDMDIKQFKARLYDEFCVEAPIIGWNGRCFIRVSIQGYNSQSDVDHLLDALGKMLPK